VYNLVDDKLVLVEFEILTTVTMKKAVFWDVTPFACCLLSVGCLRGLLFDPEDGGSRFLLNVIKRLPDYTASHFS
jgi:hypothetical protein